MARDVLIQIDEPIAGRVAVAPSVGITGWVAVREPVDINGFELRSSGGQRRGKLVSIRRPDVEAAWPDQASLGFQGFFPISDFLGQREWEVVVRIDEEEYSQPLSIDIDEGSARQFARAKTEKLRRIWGFLKCPVCGDPGELRLRRESTEQSSASSPAFACDACGECFETDGPYYNCLTASLRTHGSVEATGNISSTSYDETAKSLINRFSSGWVLDVGCGLRETYNANVVNLEIADYATTDVIGIAEKLPFRDEVFDAVMCLAVLEHTRHPFKAAAEIQRVLKPGGIAYVVVPFLQPYHGYPHHYYNMTSMGLRNLFEDMEIDQLGVPDSGLPIYALTWFLNSFVTGLDDRVAERFKQMRVGDLLGEPSEYTDEEFVRGLSDQANEILACANYMIATKPK